MIKNVLGCVAMLFVVLTSAAQKAEADTLKHDEGVSSEEKSTTFFAGNAKYGNTSQYYTNGKSDGDAGWAIGLEFCHIQGNGIGYGLDYHHSRATRDVVERRGWLFEEMYESYINLDYIGPKFIYSTPTTNMCAGRLDAGLGYSHYKVSSQNSKAGFGYRLAVNLDVRATERWGLYAGIEGIHSFYAKSSGNDLYKVGNKDITSIFRISFSLGIILTLH